MASEYIDAASSKLIEQAYVEAVKVLNIVPKKVDLIALIIQKGLAAVTHEDYLINLGEENTWRFYATHAIAEINKHIPSELVDSSNFLGLAKKYLPTKTLWLSNEKLIADVEKLVVQENLLPERSPFLPSFYSVDLLLDPEEIEDKEKEQVEKAVKLVSDAHEKLWNSLDYTVCELIKYFYETGKHFKFEFEALTSNEDNDFKVIVLNKS